MKPWLKILIGLFLGIVAGLIFHRKIEFLVLVGETFINLLKMLVGLIVFSSLVVGICHISDPKKLGRIGLRTILFYVVTTVIAICFGTVIVLTIKPGINLGLSIPDVKSVQQSKSLMRFMFSVFPSNPIRPFYKGEILQIIVFAMFFAFSINLSKDRGKPVLKFVESLSDIMAELTHVVMKFAPYGVFALMATAIGDIGSKIILPLFLAVLCIFIGCVIQIAVIFVLSLKYVAKVNVAPFFKGMKDAIIVAATTSSSSATLPVSLECARDHLGLSSDISGFVLSLGSTVNMNGTAIGQAVLSIFIAQAYGIEVTFVMILILIVTALISAIGTAGIPGSGWVMLSIVLSAMGLPLEGAALVIGIDRLRDIMATVVNILGDAIAAVYVAKKENQIDEDKYNSVTWT